MLSVKGLRVHYGKVEALKEVSLEVGKGEIVALVGANGAGKTTSLRAISGLKTPTEGEIWFEGRRIDRLPPHAIVRVGIGHVPEGRRLFPHMTVLENLKAGAYLRANGDSVRKDLERAFEQFPVLKARNRQKAGTLSGGEQQMLTIARALMGRPRLLLLDEPSLGLAPLVVASIASIIKEINGEGVSIVLVEQNARMALRLASRAYVLETGRVALEGPSGALLADEHVKKVYLGG
ncbi:MAG: ABC transporter ATP-binding protein [Candidatus Rokubacteria bacterium]|nr:ABC transporter ATP-binding protein [Candidatus Rokubacteria bacterium]